MHNQLLNRWVTHFLFVGVAIFQKQKKNVWLEWKWQNRLSYGMDRMIKIRWIETNVKLNNIIQWARLFSLGEISTKSHENQRSTTNSTHVEKCGDNIVVVEDGVGAVG